MVSVSVLLNINTGSVIISSTADGELCELRLQWKGNENGLEGFQVVENTFSSIFLPKGMFIIISELASEIFLRECVRGISKLLNSTDIQYMTDHGVHLSNSVFFPPSVVDDDAIEEFVSSQEALMHAWGEYRQSGDLSVECLMQAREAAVLYDLVSLLNFERLMLVTQLEQSQ